MKTVKADFSLRPTDSHFVKSMKKQPNVKNKSTIYALVLIIQQFFTFFRYNNKNKLIFTLLSLVLPSRKFYDSFLLLHNKLLFLFIHFFLSLSTRHAFNKSMRKWLQEEIFCQLFIYSFCTCYPHLMDSDMHV